MTDWLPSLNALRAFESVARHLTYAHAADELCVTPAAVKQLVRKLEQTLGLALVERSGRGLRLTTAGTAGLQDLTAGFDHLTQAVTRIKQDTTRKRLIISAEPSFTTGWLVPRLEQFRSIYPDIEVLIETSPLLTDLMRGQADIAIRFAAKSEPTLTTLRLFDETLGAFCSPQIAIQGADLSGLTKMSLIQWDNSGLTWADTTRALMQWRAWFDALGATELNPRTSLSFNNYGLAVQAAVAGQGVVLGSAPILLDLVAAGMLVQAVPNLLHTDVGYDLVYKPSLLARPDILSFVKWIQGEVILAKKNLPRRHRDRPKSV